MKKIILTLLLFISLDVISQSCISRLKIVDTISNIEINRRYKNKILDFESPLEDDDYITLGILSDSIDDKNMSLRIYVYYPRNINPNNTAIVIYYEDNSQDIFYPSSIVDKDNYMEYAFAYNSYSMHKKRAKRINFREIKTYNIEHRDYFIEFMKEIIVEK